MQRFWALVLLATALLKTWVSWPFRRAGSLRAFRRHYGPEGLFPKTREVQAALASPGRCTACRRCDEVRPGREQHDFGVSPPAPALSFLVLASLRSLPDADLALEGFSAYSGQELARADELCPYGVSLTGLSQLARLTAQDGAARSAGA